MTHPTITPEQVREWLQVIISNGPIDVNDMSAENILRARHVTQLAQPLYDNIFAILDAYLRQSEALEVAMGFINTCASAEARHIDMPFKNDIEQAANIGIRGAIKGLSTTAKDALSRIDAIMNRQEEQ